MVTVHLIPIATRDKPLFPEGKRGWGEGGNLARETRSQRRGGCAAWKSLCGFRCTQGRGRRGIRAAFCLAPQTPGGGVRPLGYLVLTRARGRACRNARKCIPGGVPFERIFVGSLSRRAGAAALFLFVPLYACACRSEGGYLLKAAAGETAPELVRKGVS
jgi:hypothetical protein